MTVVPYFSFPSSPPSHSKARGGAPGGCCHHKKDTMARSLRFLLLAALLLVVDCRKRDRSSAHPHQGILKPYHPGRFVVELGKKDEQHLLAGKPVMKQVMPDKDSEDQAGTAICVQDVEAPKPAVWNQILDLDSYKGKVPKVKECHNYVVRKNPDGTHTVKTMMKLGIMPGYSVRMVLVCGCSIALREILNRISQNAQYTNHYDHTFVPEKDSLIWSLDYEKYSDFDDVAGHWHLEDHPTKPVRFVMCVRVMSCLHWHDTDTLLLVGRRDALECFMRVTSRHGDQFLDQS